MNKVMIVLMIAVFSIMRADAQSSIKVKLADNSPFNVAIDGRYFNKRGTSVTVGDLPPGRHLVQIYSVMANRRGRGREDVIYEGRIRTTDGMVSILTYDPYSHNKEVTEMDFNTFNSNRAAPYNNDNNQGNNYGQNNNYNQNNNQYNQNNNQRYDNNNNGNYRQSPPPVAAGTLTDAKIDQLKTNVASKKTDTDKSNFLKDELKDEKVTTSQVSTIMDWFSFESSKVEFVKWAYSITVNKDAFNTLENKFTYKNYQDDLDNFLKSKQ